jgi:hypothetical protein
MTGQRRANWRTEAAQMVAMEAEARCAQAKELRAKFDALVIAADCRLNDCAALRERLERAEFNLRLAFLALAILVASTVIQAVSR